MNEPVEELKTRTGLVIRVRPVTPDDAPVLSDLFHHLRREDLRFRFLSAISEVGPEWISRMANADHDHVETFLAFDQANNMAVATAMLVRSDDGQRGEVAISVHGEYRNRGIGWELLSFVAEQARRRGMRRIESLESRANYDAIELERNMGFSVSPVPGDATLALVSKDLATP
ncbi:GNAT family N-acetyltransferase [Labrys okinawensis]|uniref:GNAT family N-acetyltransferase n=1 Tax=Labrys okinawensis TaxID=346911 RepID=A0A2S9Q637_9HYPH|nr:GNAT family N-acetyltransferase [Labrys okinawensis]PRH84805.1 GNAT family N-acetyltransferase [Labrys okinawensis]